MNAPKVRLGDVCEEVRERISSNDIDLEDYITTDNMLKNRGGCVCASSIPPDTSLVKYRMGDVLISNIRPYLKKIGIMALDGGCSNDVIVYRVKDPDLLPEYLYTALSQDRFFDYVMENVSGTKMPRGRRDWIRKFEFPLPLPEEQRRIVRDVDLAMKRVDAIERQFEKLRETAAACYKAELKVTFDSATWNARLSDECEVITDGDHLPPPKTSSGIPFLVISDVAGGRLNFENTRFVPREYFDKIQASRKPRPGDVLLTVTGSYGIPVEVDVDREFCFQRHIALVRSTKFLPRFLVYMFLSPKSKRYFERVATGAAQKTVSLSSLRSMNVCCPSVAEQQRLVAHLDAVKARCDGIAALAARGLANCARMRKAILAEAFAV